MNLRGETPRGVSSAMGRVNGGKFGRAEGLREGMWHRLEFCGMACRLPRMRRWEFGRDRERSSPVTRANLNSTRGSRQLGSCRDGEEWAIFNERDPPREGTATRRDSGYEASGEVGHDHEWGNG